MDIEIELKKITKEDLPELTQAMTRAFDDDTQRYLGKEKGGPPGYDDGEFFKKWLFGYDECEGYKILVDDAIVGGLLVWIRKDGNYTWGNVFVDPAWQNKGVCRRAWKIIESLYPDAKSWTLGTPSYSKKNHRVYEKLGFVKIREEQTAEHSGTSFIYRKIMPAE